MSEIKDYQNLLEKITTKITAQIERLEGGIPYISTKGHYQDMTQKDISWWTNGFWGGILWQLYQKTEDPIFRNTAKESERKLDQALANFDELHHDVGFMWLHTAVANYRITGHQKSKSRGLHAATILAGRYNAKGGFIRCWNEEKTGWVIIDSLMNIPLLYWASAETGDPRFMEIGNQHATTVLDYMIREDGSCSHIGIFDPFTGAFVEEQAGQGFAADSAWTRGQSWGIYGMILSYKHTQEVKYLDAAKKVANYFIANVSQSAYIPLVDFRAPNEEGYHDTSAGLCAACGMLEIAKHVTANEKELYVTTAKKMIAQIITKYANWNVEEDGIIGGGTVAYHREVENEVPIIYTDYFLVEGVLRLLDSEADLW